MLESFLITSRETLEAALVVGIVLAYLNRTGNREYKRSVYWGIAIGVLGSIIAALLFTFIAGEFHGRAEQVFEGTTMLVSAALLTTLIIWMMRNRHHTKKIRERLQNHIDSKDSAFSRAGILLLVAVAILREGVEMVLFLNAASFAGGTSLIGSLLGFAAAIIVSYLFFVTSKGINLKVLIGISTLLLVFFGAGLFAHSAHEFEEAGLVPAIISPLYDINHVLSEDSTVGSFISHVFGYTAAPTFIETLSYLFYFAVIVFLYFISLRRSDRSLDGKRQKN